MSRSKTDIITRLKNDPDEKHIDEALNELRRLRREVDMLKSSHRLYRISKAHGANCASAGECYSGLVSAESKRRWLVDHDLFVADGRAFAAVDTITHIYFMDAITGSLYNFGECLTSVHGRTGFVRDREAATKLLLNFKGAGVGGGDGDA